MRQTMQSSLSVVGVVSCRDMATPALIAAAAARCTVTTTAGITGTLMHVSPVSRMAKIKVGSRHERIHADHVSIINHPKECHDSDQ